VRITASAAPGQGRVVSIERETKLSGQAHDKGFLTLRGFLEQRYGQRVPLSLSASLAFEQSYGAIDGDSAASGELCALLSCLSEAPVDQQIAITGSVDQHGRIQAVGAVTEKIEGFFKACERTGLTSGQGVIPASNIRHLMLSREVIEAVRAGAFHVWAVQSIDEAIELLTGVPAGERAADGAYPEGSLHRHIEERLGKMASAIRALTVPSPNGGELDGVENR
jgi:predicted ATP-dependent protease